MNLKENGKGVYMGIWRENRKGENVVITFSKAKQKKIY